VNVGTAGWAIPRDLRGRVPDRGSMLERYSAVMTAVEINSSFYRSHRRTTYERWRDSVPAAFRFALKLPREITHVRRFVDCTEPLQRFLDESAGLGEKRAVLLAQLPPSFVFDPALAGQFFGDVRARHDGYIVCEPRHPTWFESRASSLLYEAKIARAAVDPSITPAASTPGGWDGFAYHRLHGSPRTYYSAYDDATLQRLADTLNHEASSRPTWCIFDNTALGAALANALTLWSFLERASP
jgi:uncharacterized protein YecE (DUF72 family)